MIELLRECQDAFGNIHTYAHKTDFVLKESSDMLKRLDAALAGKDAVHSVDDGFGSRWDCTIGLSADECGLEVVRPGKAQCEKCDSRGQERAGKDAEQNAAPQPSIAEKSTAPSQEGVGQGEVAGAAPGLPSDYEIREAIAFADAYKRDRDGLRRDRPRRDADRWPESVVVVAPVAGHRRHDVRLA